MAEASMAGRRALITGAASGIGLATARLFASAGASLALLDHDHQQVRAIAGKLGALAVVADLADTASLADAVATAADGLGGLDCLVNCAGIAHTGGLHEVDLPTYDRLMAINLTAPYFLSQAALPWLLQRQGSSIVNVASGAGLVPNLRNNTLYATSKGGLVVMSKALATELAPNVRVNVVCPGVTATAMTDTVLQNRPDGSPPAFLANYPMQRAAEPEEIAATILFLASDAASYVNGIAMAVDGGRCLH